MIIALSRLCREESLKRLKGGAQSMDGLMKGKHAQKKFGAVGAMPPNPLSIKTRGGGGGGLGGGGQGPGPAAPHGNSPYPNPLLVSGVHYALKHLLGELLGVLT